MSAHSAVSERVRSVPTGLIVTGYVFAVLAPLIGCILGIVAMKKHDGHGTNHGRWIVLTAGVVFILSTILTRVVLSA